MDASAPKLRNEAVAAANGERRRAAAELRSIDPRILKDMAIDRSEIDSIVQGDQRDRRRSYVDRLR